MKDIFLTKAQAEEIEIRAEQRKEYKKLGEYRPKIDGGKLYAYNRQTRVLSEATYTDSTTYDLTGSNRKTLHVEPDSIYVEAINTKNALKHITKGKFAFTT